MKYWNLVAAFVIGAAVGMFAAGAYHPHGSARDKQAFQQRMLARFSSKLRLTPDQHGKVAAILEAKREKMDALQAEMQPKFDELRTSTSAEIRQLLTPEQQVKFDAMQHDWEAKRKRWHAGHHA